MFLMKRTTTCIIKNWYRIMVSLSKEYIKNYLSLIKFSHTLFAMPFALIGFFIAINKSGSEFNWLLLGLVILCMVFARNASMAFNRYVDREFDFQNPRTALREIPSGIIKPFSALKFVILNCLLFTVATFFINRLVFYLSPVALLVTLGYSLTKRFTSFSHFVLGLGLSLAPIGAYLAVSGEFKWLPLLYSFVVLLWVAGFDILYALQDIEFDKEAELKSIPVWLGKKNAMKLSRLLHTISAGIVVYAGFYGKFRLFYLIGSTLFIGLLIFQHLIISPKNLKRLNIAFFTTNGIASVIFASFTILDLYFPVVYI